jgi:hypothetical protein
MDLETQVRRFEQQLSAFEKLHADELKDFREKLAIYMRLHADEVKLLREELAEVKRALAARMSSPIPVAEHASDDDAARHSLNKSNEEVST